MPRLLEGREDRRLFDDEGSLVDIAVFRMVDAFTTLVPRPEQTSPSRWVPARVGVAQEAHVS